MGRAMRLTSSPTIESNVSLVVKARPDGLGAQA